MDILLILLIVFGLVTVITSIFIAYKYKDNQGALLPYLVIGGLEIIFLIIAAIYSQMM